MRDISRSGKRLTGSEKAAIIMLAMNQENTAKIFTRLKEIEIKELSQSMAQLGAIDNDIIDKVIEEFKNAVTNSLSLTGNLESTEKLLESVLGKDKVQAIMDDIRGPMGKSTWDKLGNIDESLLASYLRNEYPQTAALIISKISPIAASKVLAMLPEDFSIEIMLRMLNIDSVKKEVLDKVESTLRSDFISTLNKVQKRDSNELMAEIFNNFDRINGAKFMGMLQEKMPDQAEKVKELMFTFEDIIKVKASDIQLLMRNVDKGKLTIALKGANQPIRDLFISNMSQRAAKIMQEDMASLGPVRLKDVDEAQNAVVMSLKVLIDSGDVNIANNDQDEEFVE